MYLLDTDHIAILQRQAGREYSALQRRMSEHAPERFFLSIVSFHEQVLGCHSYINKRQKAQDIIRGYAMFGQLLSTFSNYLVKPFDSHAAETFEQISSLRVDTMDLRIAAIALAWDFTVLTRNKDHFSRIPGLRVEDWTTY
jgi:tRNA(fMet)-specific endonuclease VapC